MLQRPLTVECVTGQWIGWQNSGNPAGCPINPTYIGVQTNTFTFTGAVRNFEIDFRGFDGPVSCPRMEIKINGIFYPLNPSNLVELPQPSTCTGSFARIEITSEGYLTVNSSTGASTQGRIKISNVNATTVSISSNDPSGTVYSDPFNCLPVVPLKLINFNGHSNLCETKLNWETETELNIKNIEVQRSEDGILFHKVGEVTAKGSNSQYSFLTTNSSDAYFRLKINDLDGYYEYSNILSIKSNCSNMAYQIMPNPASSSIEIIGLKNDDKIFVLDMLGRIVLTFNSMQSTNKFDIEKLIPGIYILQVKNSGLNKASMKIIKN